MIAECVFIFAWTSSTLAAFANGTNEYVVKQASAQALQGQETLGMNLGWLHHISSSLLS